MSRKKREKRARRRARELFRVGPIMTPRAACWTLGFLTVSAAESLALAARIDDPEIAHVLHACAELACVRSAALLGGLCAALARAPHHAVAGAA